MAWPPGSWTPTTTAAASCQPGLLPWLRGGADPWARLGRALRGWVDPDAFEMLRGTVSLPFSAGEQGRAAIKVIDFRGNEAIKILDLPEI